MDYPYHKKLTLSNFTAFANVTLEFEPGINVLIGQNGTGKTHILKALYAWQMARHLADEDRPAKHDSMFNSTYGTDSVSGLQRVHSKVAVASGTYGASDWQVGFQGSGATDNGVRPRAMRPVFIPAIELMAHTRNMLGIMRNYADFDQTCFDFLEMITARPSSRQPPTIFDEIADLKQLVPGSVEWNAEEDRFYLIEKGKRMRYSLVAEGVRKITALIRLVELNWLPPGSVLFWDEPEVNLNPIWFDEVIQALVILARSGVQIFLATHSYVILKQLDLTLRAQNLTTAEPVMTQFFALRKERSATKMSSSENFAELEPNTILDQYEAMLAEDWRLTAQEGSLR